MKKITYLIVILYCMANVAMAQKNSEEETIKNTINFLFDGMRNSDTTMIRKAFAAKNTMETIAINKDGKAVVRTENVNSFIKSIGTPHTEKYDERIEFNKILIDGNLASVWTNYKFYVGNKFSHCGVNSFQLFKGDEGWKIIYIIDTKRKENCN